jgi:hypothetical protein
LVHPFVPQSHCSVPPITESPQQGVITILEHVPEEHKSEVHALPSLHCEAVVQEIQLLIGILEHVPEEHKSVVHKFPSLHWEDVVQEIQLVIGILEHAPEEHKSEVHALLSLQLLATQVLPLGTKQELHELTVHVPQPDQEPQLQVLDCCPTPLVIVQD